METKTENILKTDSPASLRCGDWLGSDFTAREESGLLNNKPLTRCVGDIRNMDVLKNKHDGILEIIDRALCAFSPGIGTARELSDSERDVCKLGLDVVKLLLQRLDSLGVIHGENLSLPNTAVSQPDTRRNPT